MDFGFKKGVKWDFKPAPVEEIGDGNFRVNKNICQVEVLNRHGRQGEETTRTMWQSDTAVMPESAFFAYLGATEVESKRESDVILDYTQKLIEEGTL